MTPEQYLENLNRRYVLGNATEHTFRGDLQQLLESIVPDIAATNEPKRQSCGAPDFILTRATHPFQVPSLEAKDIGDTDLDGTKKTGNKEQFDRYKASLGNLIFTDYLHFHFYKNGEFITKLSIGEIVHGKIVPTAANFNSFIYFIKEFCTHVGQTIKSPKKLAEMMAGKARLLSDVIEKALNSDVENHENSTLKEQMSAFREILIHDITPKGFADVYAQTIAYGMFAARLHDPTLPTFSRQEAAELIPKSNPFLRKLFQYIAGPDLDDRIKWIVDNLVEIFLASDVEDILKNYGKATKTEDPIIHFYETFLSEYDPKLRKARGVWYTPHPVVNFIVRAVDDILKTEFDLPQGLADTSKIKIKVDQQGKKVEKEVHKVQILDPAAGTGTFLAEVIRQVHSKFEGQQGIWSNYVEQHLLPRLNGFEILMASYAMAHLKLDLLLTETGYKPTTNQRFKVYLTNSLEEHHADTGTLFANWLSAEANEANQIKRDTPVMCVIGNPPYSVSSSNKGEWIQNLIADYKKDLNERKINLDDDYIKFIRYGQNLIDKNGSGILAFISNNSFIDGLTHRQMRKSLLQSFDKIFILDLHGNSNRKETSPDGTPDVNVFDIMQGVSINIFIKTKNNKKDNSFGNMFHSEIYGKREFKYKFLEETYFQTIPWKEIELTIPNLFFIPKNFENSKNYNEGFKVDELMKGVSGIETKRDHFAIDFDLNILKERITDFVTSDFSSIERKRKFDLRDNEWVVDHAVDELRQNNDWKKSFEKCLTRPFDIRYIIYNSTILSRDRGNLMAGLNKDNYGLILGRQSKEAFAAMITNCVCTHKIVTVYDRSFVFPLFIYPQKENLIIDDEFQNRHQNFNPSILSRIEQSINLSFSITNSNSNSAFASIDLLDYIYAVLHSPTYREKYKEFLKIDFPRVPYPKDKDTFWQLVKLGGELRQIHLLESPVVEKYITTYPHDGSNIVGKVKYQDRKVYINDQQYFDHVPEVAWTFYIGGYQPAQKWLKDRKDRTLGFEDILHYQKIIVALTETSRLMGEIDRVEIE